MTYTIATGGRKYEAKSKSEARAKVRNLVAGQARILGKLKWTEDWEEITLVDSFNPDRWIIVKK